MNRLSLDHETLARLCQRHHIRRRSLFGSMLRGVEAGRTVTWTCLSNSSREKSLDCWA
jgi:hypothetical protein